MIKNNILIIFLLSFPILLFSQHKEKQNILKTDTTTWGKEIFNFPISFAREIPYQGFEEAQFPKNWAKKDSSEYWSYVFAWSIDEDKELTGSTLEFDLQTYFDGLMDMNRNGGKEVGILNSTALLVKKNNSNSSYIGKVKTFDRFFTKKPFILNVLVDQFYCEQKKKLIVVFWFSPKEFNREIWATLKEITLLPNACDI